MQIMYVCVHLRARVCARISACARAHLMMLLPPIHPAGVPAYQQPAQVRQAAEASGLRLWALSSPL